MNIILLYVLVHTQSPRQLCTFLKETRKKDKVWLTFVSAFLAYQNSYAHGNDAEDEEYHCT